MNKTNVHLNKPIYIRFTVLELSKLHMFKFYYETLQPKFKDVKLLYIDTDAFVLHITEGNIINKFKELKNEFDFSDYPQANYLYSKENKKVV